MENKKIRVLVAPDDKGGVSYWRMEVPHVKLDEMYGDEFDVIINHDVDWTDLDYIASFDLLVYHKGLFKNHDAFTKALTFCREHNITTVVDNDDYWDLGQWHPQAYQNKIAPNVQYTLENLRNTDYATTTTDIFAKDIKKWNPNVKVFPNAVNCSEAQWAPDDSKIDKIRFGLIMGSSHERDMQQLQGVVNSLPKEVLNKIQIVLCGYDIRGTMTILGPDKKVQGIRDIKPEESVWKKYEEIMTDNYRICSPQYQQFLKMYIPDAQYPNVENELYRREWTKNLSTFGTHYNNIDVLLVPLDNNNFNCHKSELKLVEAGAKHKAVILSNCGPYTIGTKSIFVKGGGLDPSGNCILINPEKAHKDWAKAIKRLVANPELVDLLKKNLQKHTEENYSLEKWTTERANWYKTILKK